MIKAKEEAVFLANRYNASFGANSAEREAILQGVTIGDGAVIGSGSVGTKDVPAGVIAAGVPCKVVREITEKDRTGFRA